MGQTLQRGLLIDIQKCVFVLVFDLVWLFCGSLSPNPIMASVLFVILLWISTGEQKGENQFQLSRLKLTVVNCILF